MFLCVLSGALNSMAESIPIPGLVYVTVTRRMVSQTRATPTASADPLGDMWCVSRRHFWSRGRCLQHQLV